LEDKGLDLFDTIADAAHMKMIERREYEISEKFVTAVGPQVKGMQAGKSDHLGCSGVKGAR
jgi:hypothetical protein